MFDKKKAGNAETETWEDRARRARGKASIRGERPKFSTVSDQVAFDLGSHAADFFHLKNLSYLEARTNQGETIFADEFLEILFSFLLNREVSLIKANAVLNLIRNQAEDELASINPG